MSATKNDGGPAFPVPIPGGYAPKMTLEEIRQTCGMSLRDWFAGQALAGIMSSRDFTPYRSGLQGHEIGHLTKSAYQLADNMLEARK